MTRIPAPRASFDLYDDLMAISRLDATISASRRHNAPAVKDFNLLAKFVPGLKV
ncbi:hypothetical protein [Pararhodobacter aggregans]|uniref:hypothetical protein n=1 Tax=Pararhodobacter aggregans TaxID=404875 RepID=UPI003A8D9ABA